MNFILTKKIISTVFSVGGLLSVLEHCYLSSKAIILMYHRVLNSVDSQKLYVQPGMFVTTASFEKQMAFLKDRYKVIFLEELAEKVLTGNDIGGHLAITFDDGWRDNYTNAFPVLKKYRVPATIFLATGFVGTDNIFWPEEFCYYLDRYSVNKSTPDGAPKSLLRLNKDINAYYRIKNEAFFDRSVEVLKGYSPSEREDILTYFRGICRTDQVPRQMLNWDEVQEMYASGLVHFGSHTVNHEMLDQIPLQEARDEISKSREAIENHLGIKVSAFAYPNGNHNESLQKILSESGYNAAVTTRKGFLERNMPLMKIPRIAIHDDVSNTIPMFRSRILLRKF